MSNRNAAIVILGVVILAPLALNPASLILHNLILAAAYVIMALGLNIVVGFAGLLDLGYVAFYAIGAHVAAYVGSSFWANAHFDLFVDHAPKAGIHINFLLILALAIVATALAGVLIGLPTLRLRGDYIALVTLAFGEIIGLTVANGHDIRFLGGSLTGGANGIPVIDRVDLPLLDRFRALDLRPWYAFALVLVAVTLVVVTRLRDSRQGRAWRALRDDEDVAAYTGVPLVRTKLLAYAAGAAVGGVSGAFLASYLTFVNPSMFTFSFSIFILAMVILGGLGSIWGVVAGAIVLSVFNNYLLPDVLYVIPRKLGLGFDLSEIASGIYGLLLVLVMLLRPHGILPSKERLAGLRREAGEPSPHGVVVDSVKVRVLP